MRFESFAINTTVFNFCLYQHKKCAQFIIHLMHVEINLIVTNMNSSHSYHLIPLPVIFSFVCLTSDWLLSQEVDGYSFIFGIMGPNIKFVLGRCYSRFIIILPK